MYAIYLQSKKYISHLILLSLGTVIFSGCSQSNQLEKVPEDQQPSQPTSTKRSETEVLSGASDLAQAEKMSSGSVEALNPEAKVSVAASDSETGNRILSPAQDDFDGDETEVSSGASDLALGKEMLLNAQTDSPGVAAEVQVGASDAGQPNTVSSEGVEKTSSAAEVPSGGIDAGRPNAVSSAGVEIEVSRGASDSETGNRILSATQANDFNVEELSPEIVTSDSASDAGSEQTNEMLLITQDDFDGDETVVSSEEIDAGSVLTNEMSPAGVAAEVLVGASDSGQPNSMLLITQEDPVDDLRESSPITVILPNASEGVKELRSKTKEVPGEEIDSALNNAANVAIEALVDTNIYSDVEADKSIYLGEGGGPENHECWFPWHFWKICTP